jgi:RNA polymerase sigma-70 factor (ECF subfamily)
MTLLDRANHALQKEYEKRGKSHQFEKLRIFLAGKSPETTMAVVAGQLEMTEVAAKVAVHRMRQRFGELLRSEIEKTVDQPDEIDSEIRHLFDVLRN